MQFDKHEAREGSQPSRCFFRSKRRQKQERDARQNPTKADALKTLKGISPNLKVSRTQATPPIEPHAGYLGWDSSGRMWVSAHLRLETQSSLRRIPGTRMGVVTAREYQRNQPSQRLEQYQQQLLRNTWSPHFQLFPHSQETSKNRDRAVSLRGMAATMQASVSSKTQICRHSQDSNGASEEAA